MGVDQYRFTPDVDGSEWAERLSDLGDFVMGWAGSVRKFHHVELALHAVKRLRDEGLAVGLAIAGDGQDRPRLQEVTKELQVEQWVRFVGQIPNSEMPKVLAGIDAAVITAGAGQEFHYSPLKLREYLAMGLPVIVPRLGEMARMIEDGVNGLLYPPGDDVALAAAVRRLADDPGVSAVLGQNGRSGVLESGTWDAISAACLERFSFRR
jgi:glycosyltransferase involved in cell wall biosynthesis